MKTKKLKRQFKSLKKFIKNEVATKSTTQSLYEWLSILDRKIDNLEAK